jgi:hypothetical protein
MLSPASVFCLAAPVMPFKRPCNTPFWLYYQRLLSSLHIGLRRHSLHMRHLHAIGVAELMRLASNVLHCHTADALCLRDRAVFVSQEQSLETYYLLTQLSDGSRQCVVLGTKDLDFLLEIGQPLLLALATLEGSDSVSSCQHGSSHASLWGVTHLFLSRKFLRFSSSVIFLLSGPLSISISSMSESSSSIDGMLVFWRLLEPLG